MLKVKGLIWIESSKGPLMGLGRLRLLEEINKSGSITSAAKAIGLSYRQAWELIDSMNKRIDKPFVLTTSGGRGGGGAKLTEEGILMLKQYKEILLRFEDFNRIESLNL